MMKKDFIVRRSITIVEGKPHVETYSEEPLVRCEDCHYGIRNSKEDIFCIKAIYNDKYKRPDWFCADGVMKDD